MSATNDQNCVQHFARKKRMWVWVAVPSAAILLLSIIKFARGEGLLSLQLLGLLMLVAFIAATAALCRCPRCRTFVFDKQTFTPGWTLHRCPHCDAPLQDR